MEKYPLVSVVIPCYQEEKFIEKCLDSLIHNDYPSDRMEIIVLEGGSTDRTPEILRRYGDEYPFIRIVANPEKFQAFAMNRGIRESSGDIIIRCDAHSSYSRDYIKRSVCRLGADSALGNIGGVWINSPSSGTLASAAIAYALQCPLCVGPNRYRVGTGQPRLVDTVPFGAWRREVFEKVGFFDEKFRVAEDLDFNLRLRRHGYGVLLDPGIRSYYCPRESFGKLFKMMFRYGYWKNFVNRKHGSVSSARQLLPPFFVLYLGLLAPLLFLSSFFVLPLALYFLLVVFYSFRVGAGKKSLKLVPFCACTFLLAHAGYGSGYIKGFWDVFIRKKSRP